MEIGIDIEKNARFVKSDKFFSRVFTAREISYCKKFSRPEEHFCAYWCVKEAFIKATSCRTLALTEIEVTHSESGQPQIVLTPKISGILRGLGCSEVKISLSHSVDYSTAVCIIY